VAAFASTRRQRRIRFRRFDAIWERRRAALASSRMRFDIPDAAPSDALNRILWHDARGWGSPFPGVRQSLFFPMSRDLADDEREEKEERSERAERAAKRRP